MKNNFEIDKSIRKEWSINPVTRIIQSKKKYNRKKENQEIKKQIEQGE